MHTTAEVWPGRGKTGNWGLIKLVLNQVSSSAQKAAPSRDNFLTGMWHPSQNIEEYLRNGIQTI